VAEVVRYVDPDVVGGAGDGTSWANAYSSLNAWEAAEQTNLVTDGDTHVVYCRASSGTADTTATVVGGWTTDATHYVTIEAAATDVAVKSSWDTARYRLYPTDPTYSLHLQCSHIRLVNLQVGFNYSSGTLRKIIYTNAIASGSDIRISGCRLLGENDLSGVIGFQVEDADANIKFWNTICEKTDWYGLRFTACATANVYNCIVAHQDYSSGKGIHQAQGTVTVKNTAVFDTRDDFDGTITVDYCASDDGDGTNAVAPSGSDWDNEFTDSANGNYTLEAGGNCEDGGTDDPGSGLYSTDMDGDSYTSPWSIGVDEITGGGVDACTADSIATGAPVLGTPTLAQEHALTATGVATGSPSLGTPGIAQEHGLTASGIATGAPAVGTPSVAQEHGLTATGISTGSPSLGTPTVAQEHALTANGVDTGNPTLGIPAVGQEHTLTADNTETGNPSLGTPVVGQEHKLTATGVATGAPVLGTPIVAQEHALAATRVDAGAPALGTPIVGQEHALTAIGATAGSPVLGTPTLSQCDLLQANGVVTGSPVLGTPTVGHIHVLTPTSGVAGAPSVGTPVLAQVHRLMSTVVVIGAPSLGTPTVGGLGYAGVCTVTATVSRPDITATARMPGIAATSRQPEIMATVSGGVT